jgi:hypothetical protein
MAKEKKKKKKSPKRSGGSGKVNAVKFFRDTIRLTKSWLRSGQRDTAAQCEEGF